MNDKEVLSNAHEFARFQPPIVGTEKLGAFSVEVREAILGGDMLTYDQTLPEAFNPDQPRDEHGRWAPGLIPHITFRRTADYQGFRDALHQSTRKENLADTPDEKYRNSRVYLAPNKRAGFAISNLGELSNVFANNFKGAGKAAIAMAIELGAKFLDCYDGHLPKLYSAFGFVETGRMKFLDEYAKPGWGFAKMGRPDVVYMAWRGKSRSSVRQDYDSYTYLPTNRYYVDPDKAQEDAMKAAKP